MRFFATLLFIGTFFFPRAQVMDVVAIKEPTKVYVGIDFLEGKSEIEELRLEYTQDFENYTELVLLDKKSIDKLKDQKYLYETTLLNDKIGDVYFKATAVLTNSETKIAYSNKLSL